MSDSFESISARFLRRRQFIQAATATSVASALAPAALAASSRPPLFSPLPRGLDEQHAIAAGHRAQLLLRWGDGLDGKPAAQLPLTAEQQAVAFGFNNDFIAYMPLAGSTRGLLCVNHEYSTPHMMFPGVVEESQDAYAKLTEPQIRAEMAAVGHSVFEIALADGEWQVVADSPYARRITPQTAIRFDGPAAGHPRLQTQADNSGLRGRGILSCCSGGKTPWGTVLIAEENFGDCFAGDPASLPGRDAESARDFGVDQELTHWAKADPRFDIEHEPNELNRFGWVVELDPYDPASAPVKHTALGRFEHEGATVACREGEPVVVYSGDDDEHQFIYRFVSSGVYREGDKAGNRQLLSAGTLYCARFEDDGTMRWLPLRQGEGPLTEARGFASQADVLIDTRRAAALVGATPMDRPEGIAVEPASGRVYIALTKNKKRREANPGNPRSPNPEGHVIELQPPARDGAPDHRATVFNWAYFLLGHSEHPDGHDWLCNPDNLLTDANGHLWIATDGAPDFGFADGLWCADIDGPQRGKPRQLFRCPTGAETCGPEFTPDGRTLFISVQHPGDDDGANFAEPSTRWPDFDKAMPARSAVMALTREDGKPVSG